MGNSADVFLLQTSGEKEEIKQCLIWLVLLIVTILVTSGHGMIQYEEQHNKCLLRQIIDIATRVHKQDYELTDNWSDEYVWFIDFFLSSFSDQNYVARHFGLDW